MRTFVRFDRVDVEDAVREQTAAPLRYLGCPCCGAGIVYARDKRALWVASELSVDESLRVLGLETAAELEAWLTKLTVNTKSHAHPGSPSAEDMRLVFRSAFANVNLQAFS
jgi:hypothetical protein